MQNKREQLLNISQQLVRMGLNRGTAGNASVRADNAEGQTGFLITPSGLAANKMTPSDMVWIDFAGNATGTRPPSSEWRFHLDILQNKPQVNAVIHTHSIYASTFSTFRMDMPPFHYMIALAGGDSIRCAPYALFGSQQLSDNAIEALKDRKACLLANHGMIAVGETLEKALDITQEVETLCEQYLLALQAGEPHILSQQEMLDVLEKFKSYGAWTETRADNK
ncbi:MAG: class II aldolase/adducin family protein [Methylotenera sp.]|uniref:class II aldolase/adducin family protein n=1 Tax=Methylotenera sp. TaxID=2051956 RepID=UPI0024897DD4|nr:class II aldolase/adducin family protein [Methylotenera sp.]MDI1308556.1 class II aldolase/adducin family protein [Methylotenera sp.]